MNQSSQMSVLLSSPQWRQKMSFFKDMVSSRESCAIWRVNTLSSQCLWPLMFDLATFFKAVPSCFLPWDEGILRIQFSYSYPLPKHHLNLFIGGPYKDILQTYFPSPSFWASSLTPLFPLTLQTPFIISLVPRHTFDVHIFVTISVCCSHPDSESLISCLLIWHSFATSPETIPSCPSPLITCRLYPLWSLSIAPAMKELHKDWFLLSGLLAFSSFQITQHLSIFSPAILLAFQIKSCLLH